MSGDECGKFRYAATVHPFMINREKKITETLDDITYTYIRMYIHLYAYKGIKRHLSTTEIKLV